MIKQRWPFQATESDKKLIDAINAARPLDRTSIADAIRYALRFTVAYDQEVKKMDRKLTAVEIAQDITDNDLWITREEFEVEFDFAAGEAGWTDEELADAKASNFVPWPKIT